MGPLHAGGWSEKTGPPLKPTMYGAVGWSEETGPTSTLTSTNGMLPPLSTTPPLDKRVGKWVGHGMGSGWGVHDCIAQKVFGMDFLKSNFHFGGVFTPTGSTPVVGNPRDSVGNFSPMSYGDPLGSILQEDPIFLCARVVPPQKGNLTR